MKSTLLSFLFIIHLVTQAQIVFEHGYSLDAITRIKFKSAGEKYYCVDQDSNQVILFNSDHTHWKTINLMLPQGATVSGYVFPTQNQFNNDTLIELHYAYVLNGQFFGIIINENGSIITTIDDAYSLIINHIDDLEDKLIVYRSDHISLSTYIYNLDSFYLEHVNYDGIVKRTKFKSAGEKYYRTDEANNQLIIYYTNQTIWKSISIPHGGLTSGTVIPTQKVFDNDDGIEFYYSIDNGNQFTEKIIDEFDGELLSIDDAVFMNIYKLNNYQNKLFARTMNSSGKMGTKVYDAHTLTPEHIYTEGYVFFIEFKTAGKKYYYKDFDHKKVTLYNYDHSIWKTINLDVPNGGNIVSISTISQKKINNDNLIEVNYSYFSNGSYKGKIINENGEEVFYVDNAFSVLTNEIEGLQNKLITNLNFLNDSTGTSIYRLPTMTPSNINQIDPLLNPDYKLYPNPTSNSFTLSTEQPLDYFTIQAINGQVVQQEKYNAYNSYDVSQLESGIYFITGYNNSEKIFVEKLVVQ